MPCQRVRRHGRRARGRAAGRALAYYGRVLVERVEGLCSDDEWRRAYREINEFEAQQAGFGMVIVKLSNATP